MPPELEDLVKLLLSLILGGLIGWERELYDKPAGFRTNTLICVGATLFTIFSIKIGGIPGTDSSRIAAQIVSGIGFLGAGAIIRRGEAILGLTTAATIWFVASIGMGVGGGFYITSTMGTAVALAVLVLFRRFEIVIDELHTTRTYRVVLAADEGAASAFNETLKTSGLRTLAHKQIKDEDRYSHEVTLSGRKARHEPLVQNFLKSPYVKELRY
ncbi:MAG TPA: MgtC/SapB family protein [Candidatus Binatia bacterium]|jgi:putative Mg2+ transporter-C (MgtC) family protein